MTTKVKKQLAATKGIKSTKYAIYDDIDCVMELQCVLRRNPLFELYHVYGHQDEKKTLQELDIPSRNNVPMDQAAGEYINNMTMIKHQSYHRRNYV